MLCIASALLVYLPLIPILSCRLFRFIPVTPGKEHSFVRKETSTGWFAAHTNCSSKVKQFEANMARWLDKVITI